MQSWQQRAAGRAAHSTRPDPAGIHDMLGETSVDLDRYPDTKIAAYSLTLGTENSVEMSGYTNKTGVHALHHRQPVQNRSSGCCRYDGASTAKRNDPDREILLSKTIDYIVKGVSMVSATESVSESVAQFSVAQCVYSLDEHLLLSSV